MNDEGLVRIKKKVAGDNIVCWQVFGLNHFAVNKIKVYEGSDPVDKFLASLIAPYETICLLGAPAPGNWKTEMKRQGKIVEIEDLLGKETPYHEIPVWYYGGNFGEDPKEYGTSLLHKLKNERMLRELSNVFFRWDALALILYKQRTDGLSAAKNALRGFTTEVHLIETLLREARYVVLTQADCQYLEVYTKASDVADELEAAGMAAEAYIESTEWYQKKQSNPCLGRNRALLYKENHCLNIKIGTFCFSTAARIASIIM